MAGAAGGVLDLAGGAVGRALAAARVVIEGLGGGASELARVLAFASLGVQNLASAAGVGARAIASVGVLKAESDKRKEGK